MANENVLEGISCPRCGANDEFEISGRARMTVTDDGVQDTMDPEWEPNDTIECCSCGYSGTVKGFTMKLEPGAGALRIELRDGRISVAHADTGDELMVLNRAPVGTWAKLLQAMRDLNIKEV